MTEESNGYTFRNRDLAYRQAMSKRIEAMYPDRVPVIVVMSPTAKHLKVSKCKFLTPRDITLAKFSLEVRRFCEKDGIKLGATEALFFSVKDQMPPVSTTINEIYSKYVDVDGFIYFTINVENTFG